MPCSFGQSAAGSARVCSTCLRPLAFVGSDLIDYAEQALLDEFDQASNIWALLAKWR